MAIRFRKQVWFLLPGGLVLGIWLCGLWLAGCQPLDPRLASDGQSITGGEPSAAFAATGAIVTEDGRHVCTATLVAPDMLLSAAHCFHGASEAAIAGAEFVLGMDVARSTVRVRLAGVRCHPEFDQQQNYLQWKDVAVVWLQQPISVVEPVVLHEGPAVELVDRDLLLLGYGRSATEPVYQVGQRRRSAWVTCAGLTDTKWTYHNDGSGACHGDSGGPAFAPFGDRWRQVGITSGGDNACTHEGYYTRIDVFADWLREQGVPFGERGRQCEAGDRCDGACLEDGDCTNLMWESGAAPF